MREVRLGGLLTDNWFVRRVFRQDTAGEIEVVERLFAVHPGTLGKNEFRFRLDLRDLPLGIQLGAAFGSRYTLQVPRMRQFGSIRCKPSFTVCRRVDTSRRNADKQYQQQ